VALHIRDTETDRLVRELARLKRVNLTQAVKLAVKEQLRRENAAMPLYQRLRAIARPVADHEDTGVVIYKAFFDDLSGL
jgi:antitoxin VapB